MSFLSVQWSLVSICINFKCLASGQLCPLLALSVQPVVICVHLYQFQVFSQWSLVCTFGLKCSARGHLCILVSTSSVWPMVIHVHFTSATKAMVCTVLCG